MGYKFNPFTGNFDITDSPDGVFDSVEVNGDINLDDGGSFTTTVQCVTPTQNRTISFPDATGTVALVAGSSGQLTYNNAGSNAGATGSVVDSSGNVTIGGLTTLAGSPSANNTSGVLINGTWRTGASSNNPQLLLNPSGTTLSTTWSTSGTGLGVNAASGFAGNLLDLQVNGSSRSRFTNQGTLAFPTNLSVSTAPGAPGVGNWYGTLGLFNASGLFCSAGAAFNFNSGFAVSWGSAAYLLDDAANTLAQRNGTNAQTFRVYGTFTDASNYVRAALSSTSTAVTLAAETAGTGADNIPLNLTAAGTGTIKVNSVAEVVVSSTVAGLPAAPVVGMLTRVTDATAPAVGSTVTGGGAAAALVWYNGANWSVIGV